MTFVSIDTETTGLDHKRNSIVQVAAIKFNERGEILSQIEQKFKPEENWIPLDAVEIHKISFDMVRDKQTYKDGNAEILNFCNNCELVGHNIKNFDMKFLDFKFVNVLAIHDTLELARKEWSGRLNLAACCKKAKLEINGNYHDALADAKQVMRLFLYLKYKSVQTSMFFQEEKEMVVVNTPSLHRPAVELPDDVVPFSAPPEYQWWKHQFNKELVYERNGA